MKVFSALSASVTLDLTGKTIDASGGELHLGGTRSIEKIITDNDTTLKVLGSARSVPYRFRYQYSRRS